MKNKQNIIGKLSKEKGRKEDTIIMKFNLSPRYGK